MRLQGVVVLSVLLLARAASAQEFTSIGKLKVRTDSPLVKGEYPRLTMTRAQIPGLRARMNHPELQTYLAQAHDLVKIGKADTLLLAAMYQVTGDVQYADLAKKKLGTPSWMPQWTFAFDMVAETMTEAERADYARKILVRIQDNRWRPRLLHCLAAWGNGLDEEIMPYLESSHAKEVVKKLDYCNTWSRGRGGSSMGHGYNGEHFFSTEFAAMMAWTHATGDDLVARSAFAHSTPAWYVYHYLPWKRSRQVIRVGVTMSPFHYQALTPQKFAGESYVMLAITQTKNGLGQWWQREFIGNWPMPHWSKGEEHRYGLAGRLLWLEPAIASVPPARFPETRLFPENGHVIMRSDWTEDATVALFRCGRFGEIDGYGGRNNLDNLHFIIYRNGYLAPDTGCVHAVNEGVWSMKPPSNVHHYGKQTVAHNTITVGRRRYEIRGYKNQLMCFSLRGGQVGVQKTAWFKAWGLKEKDRDGFKEGEITAYSTSPAYDYACGDATHSYPPSRVTKITRQFVYLKPDVFVVFDRVKPADPKLDIIWNLHAYRKPQWNGKTEPEKTADDKHPGGHFRHTTGNTFRIVNDQSAMVVKILLPKTDARLVRTIGGKWHDFEVNGVNCGATEATYEQLDQRKGNGALEGVGGWRIEISPKNVTGEVYFLHVLQTGKADALKPPAVTLVEAAGRKGAKIALDGKSYEVTFNTNRPTGGYIRMNDAGKVITDEALVTRIEDHYDCWKADPRYNDWMTNEYMRTVIFPYGEKPSMLNLNSQQNRMGSELE